MSSLAPDGHYTCLFIIMSFSPGSISDTFSSLRVMMGFLYSSARASWNKHSTYDCIKNLPPETCTLTCRSYVCTDILRNKVCESSKVTIVHKLKNTLKWSVQRSHASPVIASYPCRPFLRLHLWPPLHIHLAQSKSFCLTVMPIDKCLSRLTNPSSH